MINPCTSPAMNLSCCMRSLMGQNPSLRYGEQGGSWCPGAVDRSECEGLRIEGSGSYCNPDVVQCRRHLDRQQAGRSPAACQDYTDLSTGYPGNVVGRCRKGSSHMIAGVDFSMVLPIPTCRITLAMLFDMCISRKIPAADRLETRNGKVNYTRPQLIATCKRTHQENLPSRN